MNEGLVGDLSRPLLEAKHVNTCSIHLQSGRHCEDISSNGSKECKTHSEIAYIIVIWYVSITFSTCLEYNIWSWNLQFFGIQGYNPVSECDFCSVSSKLN